MTKLEKLLLKFLENPEVLRLNEIIKILDTYGYVERQ